MNYTHTQTRKYFVRNVILFRFLDSNSLLFYNTVVQIMLTYGCCCYNVVICEREMLFIFVCLIYTMLLPVLSVRPRCCGTDKLLVFIPVSQLYALEDRTFTCSQQILQLRSVAMLAIVLRIYLYTWVMQIIPPQSLHWIQKEAYIHNFIVSIIVVSCGLIDMFR